MPIPAADLLAAARDDADRTVDLRRRLHRTPEIGLHLPRTQATVLEVLAGLPVEVIIFGSGARIRFPQAAWLRPLMARRIGLETMDTAAACRTYNILAQEGRSVAAALLLEPAG